MSKIGEQHYHSFYNPNHYNMYNTNTLVKNKMANTQRISAKMADKNIKKNIMAQ